MAMLLDRRGRVVSRTEILHAVWGHQCRFVATTSLDVYVGYLRRKTEAGGEPRMIHTVRGVGFRAEPN